MTLLGLFDAAQRDQCLTPRFVRRHPRAHVIGDVQFEVTLELLIQLALGLASSKHPHR